MAVQPLKEYSIDCDYNDVWTTQVGNDYYVEIDAFPSLQDGPNFHPIFTVRCDAQEDNNSFKMEAYGDEGMTVVRNRCILNVTIKPNRTMNVKEFTIFLTHINDITKTKAIHISQNPGVFDIKVQYGDNEPTKELTVQLKSLITTPYYNTEDNQYNYFEKKDINVIANGGSERFRITGIYKYERSAVSIDSTTSQTDGNNNGTNGGGLGGLTQDDTPSIEDGGVMHSPYNNSETNAPTVSDNEEETDLYIMTDFDNGFILTQNDDKITIKSYGRPFLEQDSFYKIVLVHNDLEGEDEDLTCFVKLTYDASGAIVPQRAPQRKPSLAKKTEFSQISAVYLSQEAKDIIEIATQTARLEEMLIEPTLVINGLEENEDHSLYYVINGMARNVSISFTIEAIRNMQDGAEYYPLVKATCVSRWCEVKLDQTNPSNSRLVINILNKPLCERKASVTVTVIDYPTVSQTFTLINAPMSQS